MTHSPGHNRTQRPSGVSGGSPVPAPQLHTVWGLSKEHPHTKEAGKQKFPPTSPNIQETKITGRSRMAVAKTVQAGTCQHFPGPRTGETWGLGSETLSVVFSHHLPLRSLLLDTRGKAREAAGFCLGPREREASRAQPPGDCACFQMLSFPLTAATGLFNYQVRSSRISAEGLSILYCVSVLCAYEWDL